MSTTWHDGWAEERREEADLYLGMDWPDEPESDPEDDEDEGES
jgi:hypothetical protein